MVQKPGPLRKALLLVRKKRECLERLRDEQAKHKAYPIASLYHDMAMGLRLAEDIIVGEEVQNEQGAKVIVSRRKAK